MENLDNENKDKAEVIQDAEITEKESNNVQMPYTNFTNNQNNNFTNNQNNNLNNNTEEKNKNDIKTLKIFVLILFIFCIGLLIWGLQKNDNESNKSNSDSQTTSNNKKVTTEIKHSEVISPASEGTYVIDVSEVVGNVMPSIVAITSKTLVKSGYYGPGYFGNNQYATGAGSGIIISKTDEELLILTNKHVIEDAEQLSVKFINDKSVDATIKGSSSSKDIAIISIPLSSIDESTLGSIKIATIGSSTDLKVGQGVIAIGNALGYGQSVTTGVISALNREVTIDNITTNMIQTDAAINGGNSGGALLNSRGEVIGINSAKYSSSGYSTSASIEGMGFAIPISDVEDLIENLMNGTTLTEEQRGYLGVSGYMVTSEYSEAYDIPEGFYIKSIVKNSGADKVGLSIGNIVTEINGTKVQQFADITEILETKKAGETVELTVKYISGREYKEKKVKLTLSSYKDVNN